MKEPKTFINLKGEDFRLIFDINAMEEIQEEYGSLNKWSAAMDGTNTDGEPNIKALKFTLLTLINAGIEHKNAETGDDEQPLTMKQLRRLTAGYSLEELTALCDKAVNDGTGKDEKNE